MIKINNKKLTIVNDINEADLITHNGVFHSDEVFSTVILKNIIDKEEIKIARTSNVNGDIKGIVYDVGGGKYDHHQYGGNGERENGIKYSSFGLIWKDFGKDYLKNINAENIDDVWKEIDRKVVQTIDAVDNGQLKKNSQFDFEILTIPSLISMFNSKWDEEDNQDNYFIQAVDFAQEILYKIIVEVNSKFKAKETIEKIIEKSENQMLILDKFMPWKEFLLESKNSKASTILYVIFPSNRGGYNIYAVPKEVGSFEARKLFPESWAGLKNDELKKISGVESLSFCHNGRFICATGTLEDAIKVAKIAIEY